MSKESVKSLIEHLQELIIQEALVLRQLKEARAKELATKYQTPPTLKLWLCQDHEQSTNTKSKSGRNQGQTFHRHTGTKT